MKNETIPWQKILSPYQIPDLYRSLWQVADTLIPFFALWYLMVRSLEISYWLTLALSIPTAGFMVRTFILFHDCCHGSFFKSRQANEILGIITGILTFTPFYRWKHDHAIHHASAGNLDRRGTGDVATLTRLEYQALPWYKKLGYRTMRHPLFLFTIGATLSFVVLQRIPMPKSGKRESASVIWTDLALAGVISLLIWLVGWKAFLLVQLPIVIIACSAGVWLFYVQHQYENVYWERQDKWNFFKAAMEGSSFYQLPAILQWFSGNIGFHHIHHLSPKIPNYNLPRAYKDNPLFHVAPLTVWRSFKSATLHLWDEEQRKLVGF
ncbi:MAG: fatty acid desaturase [Anaerolineales bacterium]|nr:fatty acid desaturase [Anaerolineales bacterium]